MLSTTVIKMEDLPLPSLQPAHDITILCISMTLCKENVQEVILRGNENTSWVSILGISTICYLQNKVGYSSTRSHQLKLP